MGRDKKAESRPERIVDGGDEEKGKKAMEKDPGSLSQGSCCWQPQYYLKGQCKEMKDHSLET